MTIDPQEAAILFVEGFRAGLNRAAAICDEQEATSRDEIENWMRRGVRELAANAGLLAQCAEGLAVAIRAEIPPDKPIARPGASQPPWLLPSLGVTPDASPPSPPAAS